MKQNHKLKLFIRFLKKNNIYNTFFANCHSNNGLYSRARYKYENVIEFIDTELKDRGYLINKPFTWDETEEGYMFWCSIYNKWEKIRHIINGNVKY